MNFKYDINETPKSKGEHMLLSIQHVFAMFGSTVLVPILIGIDVGTALFCAGLGTLIYSTITKKKVPVFIGSSFAYIGLCQGLMKSGGQNSVAFAVIMVGLIYILIAGIVSISGTNWLDYILPPVVMGPLIIVIGLSLAPVAMSNSGLTADSYNYKYIIIALVTLSITLFALEKGNSFVKSIPILIGIFGGYILSLIMGLVDTSLFKGMELFKIPEFHIAPLSEGFRFDSSILFAVLPLVIVTISEHIGDHTVSSTITGRNFLKDPGLKRTILGDGLATFVAGILGGPVNTTYAENTGVIILTRVASISVIRLAALFAMIIAFMNPIIVFITSIPAPVTGGISIALFGLIAQNGIRILSGSRINFNYTRNMIIVAIILVVGLGGGLIQFSIGNTNFVFQGMSLAAVFGIGTHLILPDKKYSFQHLEDLTIDTENQ